MKTHQPFLSARAGRIISGNKLGLILCVSSNTAPSKKIPLRAWSFSPPRIVIRLPFGKSHLSSDSLNLVPGILPA
jgi:hypothetical protein